MIPARHDFRWDDENLHNKPLRENGAVLRKFTNLEKMKKSLDK